MDTTRLSNLLFLSGLAAVGLPGCDPDDGDSDTAASATASATATATATATDSGGTGGETGDASDSASASASASASGTDGTTAATASATDTDTTTGTDPTGAGAEVCPEYATWISGCDPRYTYEVALQYCNELSSSLAMISPECGAAYEELLACAIALDCSTLDQDGIPPECQAQSDAVDTACDFGGSTGGGESGTGG